MHLRDILHGKGSVVYTIRSDASLADVVQKLVKNNCGSLVVCDSDCDESERLMGIITERDILRACAAGRAPLERTTVAEVMTRDIVVGRFSDDVEVAKRVMTDKRFRHMPIMQKGKLVGIVSIGDVVRSQLMTIEAEATYLRDYIRGEYG